MSGQTRIDGNLIDTGTDPNDIVSISTGDSRYARTVSDGLTVRSGIFWENDTILQSSYNIESGKNAMTIGPVTLDTDVAVTIDGRWIIV